MPLSLPSRTFFPGEIIYKEEPFVKILPRCEKEKFCEACHCASINLRYCKSCLAVKYCGKACQKKDWRSIHRLECQNMKILTARKEADVARLIGRVIRKIKGKDWKSIKTTVLGTEVSFDDIDFHYKQMTEEPVPNLLYKELKELTKKFIGVENTPDDIDMLKIIGKVIHNSFLNADKDLPAVCFFLGISAFEHECIPNSSFVVINKNLKIWANRKIVKESEKISVSYRRIFEKDLRIYKDIEHKTCDCCDCTLPYGESTLSKVLDDGRAFSVIWETEEILRVGAVFESFGMESVVKSIVDGILEKHAGVLGRTHILHLKLLGFRCLEMGGRAVEIYEPLKTLESIMRSLFGDFSIEMLRIYEYLAVIYCDGKLPGLAVAYYSKIRMITEAC